MEKVYGFQDFLEIMDRLLADDGCPWDRVQTHESLKKYLLEESYEVIEAIEKKDVENLKEELGDVLLQVVFHAKLAQKAGDFTIEEVIDGISQKMVRRHAHIFGGAVCKTPEDVKKSWEEIKKEEKAYKSVTETLRTVPMAMPPLLRAEKVQKKAADAGFDFSDWNEAFEKVQEEIEEFSQTETEDKSRQEEEFGDILFSMVNLSRFFKINAAFALTKAIEKFINRFEYVEKTAVSQGYSLKTAGQSYLDGLWAEAKKGE